MKNTILFYFLFTLSFSVQSQPEPVIEKFKNGQIKKTGFIENGQKTGYWETFSDNGQVLSRGNYLNNKQEGKWEYYNRDGQLLKLESFKGHKLSGPYRQYFDNGQSKQKTHYKNGQFHGRYEEYYENGQLARKFKSKKRLRTGKEVNYYSDGQLRSKSYWKPPGIDRESVSYYHNGTLKARHKIDKSQSGMFFEYHENGVLMKESEMKNGVYFTERTFDTEGNLKQTMRAIPDTSSAFKLAAGRIVQKDSINWLKVITSYSSYGAVEVIDTLSNNFLISRMLYSDTLMEYSERNGSNKDGYYRSTYADGTLAEVGTYHNNLKKDLWKSYYPSGHLKFEGTYEIDIRSPSKNHRTGVHTWYYDGGQIRKKEMYNISYPDMKVSGWHMINPEKKEGNWQAFYENGNIKEDVNYLDDKLHGDYKTYHENGQIEVRAFYADGTLHGPYTSHYESGNLKAKGQYKAGKEIGAWLTLYDNQAKMIEANYTDSVYTSTFYFSDGRLAARETGDINKGATVYLITPKGEKKMETYTIREQDGILMLITFYRKVALEQAIKEVMEKD